MTDYLDGASYEDLSANYDVCTATIWRHLNKRGLIGTKRSDKRSAQFDRDAMVTDYLAGGTSVRLAAKYGVAEMTIKRELVDRGIPRWPAGFGVRAHAFKPTDDPALLGYLAAMVDGEGSIVLNERTRATVVCVTNTSEALITWLQEQFGGYVFWRTKPAKDGFKRLPLATWQVRDAFGVHRMLRAMRPYLIIKGYLADQLTSYLEAKYPGLLLGA